MYRSICPMEKKRWGGGGIGVQRGTCEQCELCRTVSYVWSGGRQGFIGCIIVIASSLVWNLWEALMSNAWEDWYIYILEVWIWLQLWLIDLFVAEGRLYISSFSAFIECLLCSSDQTIGANWTMLHCFFSSFLWINCGFRIVYMENFSFFLVELV